MMEPCRTPLTAVIDADGRGRAAAAAVIGAIGGADR